MGLTVGEPLGYGVGLPTAYVGLIVGDKVGAKEGIADGHRVGSNEGYGVGLPGI